MIDSTSRHDAPPINFDEIADVDQMLRAAQLLRQSEQYRAWDNRDSLAERLDPDGSKLNAYSLGLLDGVRTIAGGDIGILRLLAYLLMLCETGPGHAPEAAERILNLEQHDDLRRYVERGRQTVFDVFVGDANGPGQFAMLLADSTTDVVN